MGVMQVVGSSRISNTAYLAVASIYWTLFVNLSGFPLNLDVQTALILVTPAAGIAALLWVLRIEEVLITSVLLTGLPRYHGGEYIRYHMGYTVLHLRPWKEVLLETETITQSLHREIKRTIRTPLLKEEMEGLYLLFWLILSIPPLFLLLKLAWSGYPPLIDVIQVIIIMALILTTLFRKRAWPSRVLGFSFCSWALDTIGTKKRRRIDFRSGSSVREYPVGRPAYFPQEDYNTQLFMESTTPWLNEIVNLANREDWHGFDKNLLSFLNSQGIVYNRIRAAEIIDSFLSDTIWSFKRKKVMGPYQPGGVISYDQAHPLGYRRAMKLTVFDALGEIQLLQENVETSWWEETRTCLDRWSSLKSWNSIYLAISQSVIEQLSDNAVKALAELPWFMNDMIQNFKAECKFRGTKTLIADLVICLQRAVDQELVSPHDVFRMATEWGVMPKEYIEHISPSVRPLVLEERSQIPAVELVPVVRKIVTDSPNLDADKVASNLTRYKEDPEFKGIVEGIRHVVDAYPGKAHAFRAKDILIKLGVDNA